MGVGAAAGGRGSISSTAGGALPAKWRCAPAALSAESHRRAASTAHPTDRPTILAQRFLTARAQPSRGEAYVIDAISSL
jgi:hypothetical protein